MYSVRVGTIFPVNTGSNPFKFVVMITVVRGRRIRKLSFVVWIRGQEEMMYGSVGER